MEWMGNAMIFLYGCMVLMVMLFGITGMGIIIYVGLKDMVSEIKREDT